jgi:hypothetical protein
VETIVLAQRLPSLEAINPLSNLMLSVYGLSVPKYFGIKRMKITRCKMDLDTYFGAR